MKFLLVTVALMACSALAQDPEMTAPAMSGEDMPEGEMESGEMPEPEDEGNMMMPSKEDMFMMKLAPIVMKMKMKMAMKVKVRDGFTVS